MKPKGPAEVWDALEERALDDVAEEVAKLSDEELDARMAERGDDPADVRARGAAIAARVAAQKAGASGRRGDLSRRHLDPRGQEAVARPARRLWLSASAVAIAAGVIAIIAWRGRPRPDSIAHDPSPAPGPTVDLPPDDLGAPIQDASLRPPDASRREK